MHIQLRIDSATAQAQLRRWGGELRARVAQSLTQALQREAVEMQNAIRAQVARRMKVVRPVFLRSLRARVV